MSPIVEVKQLQKAYKTADGPFLAVKDVSFCIDRGEIFSLLGPNGAGKTTTISMLSCLLKPTGGDAFVDGQSVIAAPHMVKQMIGVVPQEIALYDTITARENLAFWGKMYGLRGDRLQSRITAVLDIAGLADRADDKVETYSGGMKRRINIAVGLLHDPKVLYMDEPTVGIDPQSRRRILDTVKVLNEQGLTVIYTTHYMEEAEELSDRIGIIDHGRLITVGSQKELTKQVGEYDIVDLHVGLDGHDGSDFAERLAGVAGVHHVGMGKDGSFLLQVEHAHEILADVVQFIAGQGLPIRQLAVQEPNLEAVFLHLTGRALRD